jgi:prefoldin subunit 5
MQKKKTVSLDPQVREQIRQLREQIHDLENELDQRIRLANATFMQHKQTIKELNEASAHRETELIEQRQALMQMLVAVGKDTLMPKTTFAE